MLIRPYPPSSVVSLMASKNITLLTFLQEKVNKQVPYIMSAISERARKLSEEDYRLCEGYLSINAFPNLELNEQVACYSMMLEAEHLRDLNRHIKNNQKYRGDESIFTNQELRESICYDNELINYDVINRVQNTNISKTGNQYIRMDSRIPLCFYHWLEDCFKESSKAVRIDPHEVSNTMPSQMVLECLIQPPKRDWWSTLKIYNGESAGSSFILLGDDIKTNYQDYYDFNVLGIRKLQVSVRRQNANERNGGNMQMMIEELSKIYETTDKSKSYMIGRIIHLDTDAKTGTPFKDAILNHIDLAENLYIGDAAYLRDSQDLSQGDHRIVDAEPRTHLLRVNNIPFESVFKFAYAFFKSKQLVDEWKAAEFV